MSILKRKRNVVLAGLAAVGILAAGTVAYAAFSSSASASATGTSANMAALTVNTTSIDFAGNETGLWPNVDTNGNTPTDPSGGTHLAQVLVNVTNPNEVAVKVHSADITGSATFTNPAVQSACGGYLLLTSPLALDGGVVNIPAHGSTTLTIDNLYLHGDAPNPCANQAFTTSWSITAHAL